MPGSMPEVIAKAPTLKRLDALSKQVGKLKPFLDDLLTSPEELPIIAYKHKVATTADEVSHLRNDWFFAWWPDDQPVEPIVRAGLITAIEVCLREPGAKADRAKPLPIDSYWVCHPAPSENAAGGEYKTESPPVEVSVTWSDQQVTMIIYTPEPPYMEDVLTGKEPIIVVKRDPKTGKIERVRP